jgi:hypothetical protein
MAHQCIRINFRQDFTDIINIISDNWSINFFCPQTSFAYVTQLVTITYEQA